MNAYENNEGRYQEGDIVEYRGSFGRGPVEVVTILHGDEKNGEVVYDLSNGRWCYESQIIKKIGEV